ncbi:MAG: dienelactone hydrolase family protein [Acidimicrobiia bacterium]|nr:dienelactone hydrolase family protein [Acidimicrobiia bacterium]
MAHVLVVHHVQGLTDGVAAFCSRLRDAGHEVSAPDLFDGQVFDTIEAGLSHVESVGFQAILESVDRAAAEIPVDLVYAGFSLGAMAAHRLSQTRPGARGALLYHHGDVPIETFGNEWPEGVDVQIHIAERDEFREEGVPEAFVAKAAEVARADLFLYPGSSHLFMDSSLDGYDRASSELAIERTLEFLG